MEYTSVKKYVNANAIVPFILTDQLKKFYYKGEAYTPHLQKQSSTQKIQKLKQIFVSPSRHSPSTLTSSRTLSSNHKYGRCNMSCHTCHEIKLISTDNQQFSTSHYGR